MGQVFKIAKAWVEVIKGTTTEEHKYRASICKGCSEAKEIKILTLIKDELKDVRGLGCGLCGCPLVSKIRSTDKCYKWNRPTIL